MSKSNRPRPAATPPHIIARGEQIESQGSHALAPLSGRAIVTWIIALVAPIVIAGLAAYFVAAAQNPVYAARAEVVFEGSQGDISEQYRSTQTVVVTGRPVLTPVADALSIPIAKLEDDVSVDFPKSGAVMRIQYADANGDVAVDVLNAILDQYTIVLGEMGGITGPRHRLLLAPVLLEEPVQPKPLRTAAIGAAAGLAISFAAFVILRRRRGGW